MNARDRMMAAICRQPHDRIPTDIWATAEVWKKLETHFGSRQQAFVDLHIDGIAGVNAVFQGPTYSAPPGESVDMWGIRTKPIAYKGGVYQEQSFNPLSGAITIDDLEAYRWLRADWFDYSRMREIAQEKRKSQVVQCGYMAPFFMHNKLRGLEASLIDPLDKPEFTHHLLNRLCDFLYDHHRRMFETCEGLIDIAQVTDDLGCQTGPIIGLQTYREFYAPHHKRFIELCHEFGIRVLHHDDGSIRTFLPDLIDMGIDILNPVQWTCADMDMVDLKRDF
ncbi:MAG: uroporphyrinogen decarboxylase family protein, partial [Candidatus Latescibacteria bacterium]|nr:uroporphyrinogen decarboxylase family protein [Candidatus Latescibacterota bacterium]